MKETKQQVEQLKRIVEQQKLRDSVIFTSEFRKKSDTRNKLMKQIAQVYPLCWITYAHLWRILALYRLGLVTFQVLLPWPHSEMDGMTLLQLHPFSTTLESPMAPWHPLQSNKLHPITMSLKFKVLHSFPTTKKGCHWPYHRYRET